MRTDLSLLQTMVDTLAAAIPSHRIYRTLRASLAGIAEELARADYVCHTAMYDQANLAAAISDLRAFYVDNTSEYHPDVVFAVGDHLIESMEYANIPSIDALARALEISVEDAAGLFDGTTVMSDELAEKISAAFGGTPSFWVNLDRGFRAMIRDGAMLATPGYPG